MATTFTKYTHTSKILANAGDWEGNTLKLALVTSSYTPSAAHTQWSDASSNEVASGSGYTTGGETLAGKASTDTSLDSNDITWTTLTKTFRYGILYISGTVYSITDPLLGYILFDDSPADITVSGVNYTVQVPAAGWFTLS